MGINFCWDLILFLDKGHIGQLFARVVFLTVLRGPQGIALVHRAEVLEFRTKKAHTGVLHKGFISQKQ
eukprot:4435808-Amphidinium_carterae.1